MPLVLECTDNSGLPVDVTGITPCALNDASLDAIKAKKITIGNQPATVADCFTVQRDIANQQLSFTGKLENVHHIGAGLSSGMVTAEGSVGRHVGSAMSGGQIKIDGNADDYVGFEMTGGKITIVGDAADHVGSCYPGAPFGMNRGTIIIHRSAGDYLGYRMRRGTIVVGGNAGRQTAWQMRAGTIIIAGQTSGTPGKDMKRGTIVVGSESQSPADAFLRGSMARSPVLNMLGRWLTSELGDDIDLRWLAKPFQSWHGDRLHGSRGELFVRQ